MLAYLRHPEHGQMTATTADEIQRLTTLYGWEVFDPEVRNTPPTASIEDRKESPVEVQVQRKKRGPYKKRKGK